MAVPFAQIGSGGTEDRGVPRRWASLSWTSSTAVRRVLAEPLHGQALCLRQPPFREVLGNLENLVEPVGREHHGRAVGPVLDHLGKAVSTGRRRTPGRPPVRGYHAWQVMLDPISLRPDATRRKPAGVCIPAGSMGDQVPKALLVRESYRHPEAGQWPIGSAWAC